MEDDHFEECDRWPDEEERSWCDRWPDEEEDYDLAKDVPWWTLYHFN
tara:strand:- start:39 stop:179 length:141 start_codon:yes stop_codon:yes gene_type:complete